MISKLVLGTVQFGLNYGINNTSGQIAPEEVQAILSYAYNADIITLDTSCAYGSSECVIGNVIQNTHLPFKIISKYLSQDQSVEAVFNKSARRLGVKSLYGYIVHHFDSYLNNVSIWNDFIRLKEAGKVQKIGFSIYSVDQLRYLLDNNVHFDLIQFPYNIFDRQFESYFDVLKERNVEIHTRSIFLQGLFFKDTDMLPTKLLPMKRYLNELHQYCVRNDMNVTQIALNFAITNNAIDGVLMGVDNVEQLKSNISIINAGISQVDIDYINSIIIKEKELLNPVNWK